MKGVFYVCGLTARSAVRKMTGLADETSREGNLPASVPSCQLLSSTSQWESPSSLRSPGTRPQTAGFQCPQPPQEWELLKCSNAAACIWCNSMKCKWFRNLDSRKWHHCILRVNWKTKHHMWLIKTSNFHLCFILSSWLMLILKQFAWWSLQ